MMQPADPPRRNWGPMLAAGGVLAGVLLFGLAITYTFRQQQSVDRRICQQTVENRDAARGIWEGARRLSLRDVTDDRQREELDAFFEEILRPYPALECRGGTTPKPISLAARYELASYTEPAASLICLPFLPATCPPPPSEPPPKPPSSSDDPPKMVSLFVDARTRRTVKLGWETAQDEEGIASYRVYRDSVRRATTGPRARRAWVWLPCGFHVYAVEAVDTAGQRDAMNLGVRRRC